MFNKKIGNRMWFTKLRTTMLASAIVSGFGTSAYATTSIGCGDLPYTITSSGTYVLSTDCDRSGASDVPAINIYNVSNVVLDLDGNTLTGPAGTSCGSYTTTPAIAVFSYAPGGITNIHVTNGTLRQWGAGLYVANTSYSTFDGLTVYDSYYGMNFMAGANTNKIGFASVYTPNGNTIYDICYVGIQLRYTSDANDIYYNNISDTQTAIYSENPDYNDFQSNIIADNDYGIYLSGDSTNNLVWDNTFTANRLTHIRTAYDANYNQIHYNDFDGDNVTDVGMDINTDNNIISNSTMTDSEIWGIAIHGSGNDLYINDVSGSGTLDMVDTALGTNAWGTYYANTFSSDNEAGMDYGPGVGYVK